MSENNPYSPPVSVIDETLDEEGQLSDPQKLPASQGWAWISAGYGYFKKGPLAWVLIALLLFAINIGLSFIPFISLITNILMPVFLGGIMLGCQAIDRDGEIQVAHLFAGFNNNGGKLAGLGGLYLLGFILVGIVSTIILVAFGGMEALTAAGNEGQLQPGSFGLGIALAFTVGLLLFTFVLMGFWFASPLIVLHDLPIMQAVLLSFDGCKKNMLPFLVYGLIALLLSIVAAIPFFLGFLVLSPVFMASVYTSYKEIFLTHAPAYEEPDL